MLARMFAGPFAFLYWIVGAWGFFLSLKVLYSVAGIIGVIVGILVTPVSFVIAPLYAGFAEGYWLPAIVSYVPMAVMMIFSVLAAQANR